MLDESGEFASVGKELLAANGPAAGKVFVEDSSQSSVTEFDVFVCHATEDKAYVEPLAKDLQARGIKVWVDSIALEWGDDLRGDGKG